ncbi:MAG: hypothetical protein HYT43_00905 [Candidatus Taylorbacteria bacterium]|nr:hypothetical protein [Candidatus Taylorbacteria bacterium]
MKTEQATYTESQVQELIAKAIKQDREFQAQVLRALPLVEADVKQGWIENPKSLGRQLENVLCPATEQGEESAPKPRTILRKISKGEVTILRKVAEATISKCAGTRTIADSGELFSGYLNNGFRKIKGNRETPDTKTEVHEMVENATFAEMFNSLGRDLNTLVFTQDQVIEFCTSHRNKLRTEGHGTFFLLKEGDQCFVACVYFYDDGRLKVSLFDFEYDIAWDADYRRRIIWDANYRRRVVVPSRS